MEDSSQKLSSLNFDKLNVDNYHAWEFSMRMFLIGKNLWEIVQGTETLPNDANDDTKEKFQKRSNVALATVCLGVSKDLQIIVRPSKTAKEAWDSLATRFVEKTLSKKIFYRRKLYNAHMAPKADMTAHIDHIKMISEHLEACGNPISEEDLVMVLISSWPPEYNNLVTTLETLSEDKLTWTYVRDRAIAECDRIARRKDVHKTDNALYTRHDGGGFSHGRGSDVGRGRGRGRGSAKQSKKQKQCYKCHETGHLIRDCPKNNNDKKDNEDAKIAVEGQFDDECEFAFTAIETCDVSQDDTSTPSDCDSSAEYGDAEIADESIAEQQQAFVTMETDGGQEGVTRQQKPWLLDSGCSRHMTPTKTDFKRYLEFRVPIDVKLADKTTIPGYGIGDVMIKLFDGNEFVPVTIKNVLFVPQLQERLLSITDMTERGCSVTFEGKVCTLKLKGKTFLFGQRYGKLWRMNNCENEECFFAAASEFCNNSVSLELWHQRYGHLSYGNLNILNTNNMVEGLSGIDSKSPPCDEKCEGCIMGKHNRAPFPKKSSRVTTKPLELVHTDVCGPMSVDSIGRSRYFITFTDDYSRFVVTYTMKHKDEALDKFKEFVAMAETKFGYRITKTRSDNGGEYCSKAFEDHLKERGTQNEHTTPYTPQQNGTAERMNRTLMEKVRSMLYHSKLPLRFWAEALMVATYVRNCSPTCALKETPYERWNGEKPDVSIFRVFGCKAYARIPDEKRKKLDPKSQKCIFVGYPAGVKGYKLYDPVKQKMIVRRDVVFIENVFDHAIKEKGEPDELLPAICFDFDYEDDDDSADDARDATRDVGIQDEIDNPIGETVAEEVATDDMMRNRPRRNVNPINRYGTVATHRFGHWELPDEVHMAIGAGNDDPKSYRNAMNGPDSTLWKTAADVEMDSIVKNKTWDLVDLPPGKTAIGSKWVFKTKTNADGSINKHKARLVAQGYAQQHGIDYEETFSPVVKYESLRAVLAIANQHNMEIHQMDVNAAYLNGDIDADIYMRQPEGYINPNNPNKVCKLRKGLYGLKQGGRIWNEKIDKYLKSQGYIPSDADPCIYVKCKKGKIVIIALYVDDTIIVTNCNDMLHSAKKMLNEKFDMTDLGEVKSILGMSIKRNRKDGVLTINQSAYLRSVLERFGMADCNPVSTPIEPGKHYERTPDNEEGFETREFQALIGSLVYASIATRPDLSEAVGKLSQHMSRPNKEHWVAAKRLLRYVKGTLELGLKFERSNNFELVGYSDADWAGDVDTRKSTSGYVFMLGQAVVAWASKKQSVVALSTTEAEYIALCSATQEAVWLRRLLEGLQEGQARSTTIFEDNQGAICLSKNPKDHSRTKHIDIKYHYVRHAVQKEDIDVRHCETKRMIADTLTKGLPKPAFEKHRDAMNIGAC